MSGRDDKDIKHLSLSLPRQSGKTAFYRWVEESDPTYAEAAAEAMRRFGKREDHTLIELDELTKDTR
jgi:hypothetical protein